MGHILINFFYFTLSVFLWHTVIYVLICSISDSLIDSIAALDLSAHLEETQVLDSLLLERCDFQDSVTCLNLFKGLRTNRTLQHMSLARSNLNTQSLKVSLQ